MSKASNVPDRPAPHPSRDKVASTWSRVQTKAVYRKKARLKQQQLNAKPWSAK